MPLYKIGWVKGVGLQSGDTFGFFAADDPAAFGKAAAATGTVLNKNGTIDVKAFAAAGVTYFYKLGHIGIETTFYPVPPPKDALSDKAK